MPSCTVRTEQFDLEPDLRQRLYEVRGLLGRDVPAVPAEHVQPVRPVCPARDVRGDRVGQRALRRDQRERKRGGNERRRAWAPRALRRRRGAVRGRDFGDEREVEPVGQVLEPAAHRELGLAVDVVEVLQAVILRGAASQPIFLRQLRTGMRVVGREERGGIRTRRMNRHGRAGRRGVGAETGIALRNHAPCRRQWIRCWRTNSLDSL